MQKPITMVKRERPPHVVKAIIEEDHSLLSHYGSIGAKVAARRRRKPLKALPLFVNDLDPQGEFPSHHVLYRGPHFIFIKPKKLVPRPEPTISVRAFLRLYTWVHDPEVREQIASEREELDTKYWTVGSGRAID